MEEERIDYEVLNTVCSCTQPDRNTLATHQIPLVTFFCLSVYGGPARGIGTYLERFRVKIPDYFCLGTYERMGAQVWHDVSYVERQWAVRDGPRRRSSVGATIRSQDV